MPSDTTEPDTTTELTDPDDYHRQQRLKEIHQARQRVHKTTQNLDHWANKTEHKNAKYQLAVAVAQYYAEIEPLLDATDQTIELPDGAPWDTASDFADRLGLYEGANSASAQYNLLVFREINQFVATVRPLIMDGDDEADTDYSDLL